MQSLTKSKKILIIVGVILILPLFLSLFSTINDIIFNLGVHFGTSARYTMEGVCCR